MNIIGSIGAVESLTLPSAVKHELTQHLTKAFDTQQEAEQFWQDENCFLIVIEPTDRMELLSQVDEQKGYWLDFITTYPEEVLIVGDTNEFYLLAMAIVNDSGSGGYLLTPITHQSIYKTRLKNHINNN